MTPCAPIWSRATAIHSLETPFKPETLLLWLSPVLVLGLGVGAALFAQRRAPRATPRLTPRRKRGSRR